MKFQQAMIRHLWMLAALMLWGVTPGLFAQSRQLHWDALEVQARLNADGVLDVVERHTMVFTGNWNGGERIFDLRPRQKLDFIGLERIDAKTGAAVALRQASVTDEVDEFNWADSRTLRWRSRLPSDPSFSNTPLIYQLHYRLSGILQKDGNGLRLDHDFAFSNRPGPIAHFYLNLTLDPAWQPQGEIHDHYTGGPIDRGNGFVVTVPLRNTGTAEPIAIDNQRPQEIVMAVAAIFLGFTLLVLGFFRREKALGRFDEIDENLIDSTWIRQNILVHPAEVVGMAWDGRVGTPEVVALIARMTAEGKLESEVRSGDAMTLRLKVDRKDLNGHERALVDGLFFGKRTETSTTDVKNHYKSRGFNPAQIITPELSKKVKTLLPKGEERVPHLASIVLFFVAAGLFGWSIYLDPLVAGGAVFGLISIIVVSALLQIPGWLFKTRIDWDRRAALGLMIPAFVVCLVAAMFLWFLVGTGKVGGPPPMIGAIVAWALCIASISVSGMKSRQSSAAIAFRKKLAAGRIFFVRELSRQRPELQDEWYPWLLAFGLGKQVDVWSSRNVSSSTTSYTSSYSSHGGSRSSSSSSTSSAETSWTGGGGFSGGAGASGAWAAAVTGIAAGVAAPSSSSSSSGGSSSSSSSSGSSGGGGGGGW
jgi:hypothetical protein